MAKVPKLKPEYTKAKASKIVKDHGFKLDKCFLIGIRGYYKKTMGNPLANDIGIYDDALMVISPEYYATFNANTDPSVQRYGMANMVPGVYDYKIGIHNISKPANRRYKALVQAGEVTVDRYDKGLDTGWFGINIHKGSYNTTSSLGCQTIYPDQWNSFLANVEFQMKKHDQKTIKYILISF